MDDIAWPEISREFVGDGSLVDVYVFGTDISDWQQTIDLVRKQDWWSQFEEDGEVRPLPASVEAIFARRQDHAELLRLRLGRINANCHFFDKSEIEFDFDPREFRDQSDLDVLCSFMRSLGRQLGKPVVMTPENTRGVILLRYDHERDRFEHRQNDPESCSYVPLPADLERLVRQRFVAEFAQAAGLLDLSPETAGLDSIGLDSVSSSVERDEEGGRWLRLLATDSTRWYVAWDGDPLEAISLGGHFGETVAESFAL